MEWMYSHQPAIYPDVELSQPLNNIVWGALFVPPKPLLNPRLVKHLSNHWIGFIVILYCAIPWQTHTAFYSGEQLWSSSALTVFTVTMEPISMHQAKPCKKSTGSIWMNYYSFGTWSCLVVKKKVAIWASCRKYLHPYSLILCLRFTSCEQTPIQTVRPVSLYTVNYLQHHWTVIYFNNFIKKVISLDIWVILIKAT